MKAKKLPCARCGHSAKVHLGKMCCASRYMKNDRPACTCAGYQESKLSPLVHDINSFAGHLLGFTPRGKEGETDA